VRDLLRAPALAQQLADRVGQNSVASDPSLPRLARTGAGGLLGMVRAIPPVLVTVATDLATDRRCCPTQLAPDRTGTITGREQISDHDPLVLAEIPRTPRFGWHDLHRRIVQDLTRRVRNRPPIPPPVPRLTVDPNDPASLRVGDPLTDQLHIPLLLFSLHSALRRPSSAPHHNLQTAWCCDVRSNPPVLNWPHLSVRS
jgi:hypothetical protein